MAQVSSYYYVEDMHDMHDEANLKKGLSRLPGIKSVTVNLTKSKVGVDYDNTGIGEAGILNHMFALGYPCVVLRGGKI